MTKSELEKIKGRAQDTKLLAEADATTLAAIRQQQQRRSGQVARMRDQLKYVSKAKGGKRPAKVVVPVLSDAEIARQTKALADAYAIFKAIRAKYARSATAKQARGEIMVMVQHWRTIARWDLAAELGRQYLTDNAADRELPTLNLAIARDYLAWAAQPIVKDVTRQERLSQVAARFAKARTELAAVVKALANPR